MRFLFAVLCLAGSAMAQTNFSGFVNGTVRFTKAQSPVTFDRVIIQSGTLIVDAGVEMIAATSNSSIYLTTGSLSRLSIQGTELEPVLIRPAGNFVWRGIYNMSRSSRSKFEISNAIIVGLGSNVRPLHFLNAELNFVNSIFQGSRTTASGAATFGIANSGSIGLIEGCLIDGFTTGLVTDRGLLVVDADIRNTVTPITIPQSSNVTVSIAIE